MTLGAHFTVVIPARYESRRLPGKALREIAAKPLIQHVYERARESGAGRVIIATDDSRIEDASHTFEAEVCMTSSEHRSGTERIAEVIEKLHLAETTIVVNVQGDEPMLPPVLIDQVANDLATNASAQVTTLSAPIDDSEELFNPNVCKVVTDINGYALYFSRAPIPWNRPAFPGLFQAAASATNLQVDNSHYRRHIGIYAYTAGFVSQYVKLSSSPLEQLEVLEQLRVLYYGYKIHVTQTSLDPGIGVDTLEDLQKARKILPVRK